MRNPLFQLYFSTALLITFTPPASGAGPYYTLGPAEELALDQPRIAVEFVDPDNGRIVGPNLANTFLLDTGANSILIVDDAIRELNQGGYRTEGTFFEQGVGGFSEFDVSAAYDINFAGSDGQRVTIEDARALSSTTESFCPVPGLCSFFGIMGMPAMENRVTTLNMQSLVGDAGGGLSIDDIFTGGLEIGFLETTFSDTLPATDKRRVNIPVHAVEFLAEGPGPLPSWSDLPFLEVTTRHDGNEATGNYVLDTGAQLSLIASHVAFGMGLDANGNGRLDDEAVAFQEIGGVGGTINAPIMLFEELAIETDDGVELRFSNMQAAVVDIDPTIDGIFGMNLLTSGWSGALFGDLSELGDLLDEAGLADLLEELGGLGQAGEIAPFGYFEKAHFDFRNWDSGKGTIVLDLMPEVSGISAHDGTHGDLDDDGDVDFADRTIWVLDVEGTSFGDANLDGVFDSRDLVQLFTLGEYEDDLSENSTWESGDFNMDAEFTSKDLVLAFESGGYTAFARPVPEPTGLCLGFAFAMTLAALRRA